MKTMIIQLAILGTLVSSRPIAQGKEDVLGIHGRTRVPVGQGEGSDVAHKIKQSVGEGGRGGEAGVAAPPLSGTSMVTDPQRSQADGFGQDGENSVAANLAVQGDGVAPDAWFSDPKPQHRSDGSSSPRLGGGGPLPLGNTMANPEWRTNGIFDPAPNVDPETGEEKDAWYDAQEDHEQVAMVADGEGEGQGLNDGGNPSIPAQGYMDIEVAKARDAGQVDVLSMNAPGGPRPSPIRTGEGVLSTTGPVDRPPSPIGTDGGVLSTTGPVDGPPSPDGTGGGVLSTTGRGVDGPPSPDGTSGGVLQLQDDRPPSPIGTEGGFLKNNPTDDQFQKYVGQQSPGSEVSEGTNLDRSPTIF